MFKAVQFFLAIVLPWWGLSACSTVQPWERGNLARPIMAPDPSPLQSSLRVHIYASREAAGAATFGAAGGGCGCN